MKRLIKEKKCYSANLELKSMNMLTEEQYLSFDKEIKLKKVGKFIGDKKIPEAQKFLAKIAPLLTQDEIDSLKGQIKLRSMMENNEVMKAQSFLPKLIHLLTAEEFKNWNREVNSITVKNKKGAGSTIKIMRRKHLYMHNL